MYKSNVRYFKQNECKIGFHNDLTSLIRSHFALYFRGVCQRMRAEVSFPRGELLFTTTALGHVVSTSLRKASTIVRSEKTAHCNYANDRTIMLSYYHGPHP